MHDIKFQCDPKKDASNQKKHGISFQEAKFVFYDEAARIIKDPIILLMKKGLLFWG